MRFLSIAVLLLTFACGPAKAAIVSYAITASLQSVSGQGQQSFNFRNRGMDIENGQIVAFQSTWPTITQGPGVDPFTWHVNISDTSHQSPFNQSITNCPLGCYIDMVFATPDNGTLEGYEGGEILSLTFFSSSLGCPIGGCFPISITQFDLIPGTGNITSVPEPSTWAMLLIGFAAIGFGLNRRRLVTMPPSG